MRRHPRIYLPERRKEVHFFDEYHERGRAWYEQFFPDDEQAQRFDAIGEVTPRYLFHPRVPERIHALIPEVRLIAILRDPIERCRSHHGLAVRDMAETRCLADYLDANPEVIERGFYAQQLARFLQCFPREHIELLVYERAVRDPAATASRLARFLGVPEAGFDASAPPLNRSYRPRFPKLRALAVRSSLRMRDADRDHWLRLARKLGASRWFGERGDPVEPVSPELHRRLTAIYADDRVRLEELLGAPLTEWGSG